LITGRQLVELCVFFGDLPLHDICQQFNVKVWLNTGWPKKVSHYRESSLNRIKNRKPD